ncbi:MAG TPA: hypothetical protein DCR93_26425, partial [Cytophagales bacterium]|nr:hypothetical protein [Cytophagales bacterium]
MQPKITLTLLLCILCRWGYGQVPFTFQELAVAPGTKAHFTVPITDGTIETFLPITIFHGTEVGPVLGLTAGVHGYEYGPILAGQRLIGTIDPTALRGTVILVQVASVGSFLGRSPYVSPLDEKNLNRVFPGSPEGTVTERIAYFLSTKVIPRCTHFVDAHSGDAPEDLADYSAYYQHDDLPEASQVGRDMARHMGYDRVE